MIRLDNFPGSLHGKPFRTMRGKLNLGVVRCEECGRLATKRRPKQIMCGRIACRKKRENRLYRIRKRLRRGTLRENMLPPQGPPTCPSCNRTDVRFGSDPRLGVSTMWCRTCGTTQLPRYGTVRYDQRLELEDEIDASIARAQAPVDKGASERSAGRTLVSKVLRWGKGIAGDGFRQQSHKKGTAGYLGEVA